MPFIHVVKYTTFVQPQRLLVTWKYTLLGGGCCKLLALREFVFYEFLNFLTGYVDSSNKCRFPFTVMSSGEHNAGKENSSRSCSLGQVSHVYTFQWCEVQSHGGQRPRGAQRTEKSVLPERPGQASGVNATP